MSNEQCGDCPLGNGNKHSNWATFKQKIEMEVKHQAEEDKEMKADIKSIKRFMITLIIVAAAYGGHDLLKFLLGWA